MVDRLPRHVDLRDRVQKLNVYKRPMIRGISESILSKKHYHQQLRLGSRIKRETKSNNKGYRHSKASIYERPQSVSLKNRKQKRKQTFLKLKDFDLDRSESNEPYLTQMKHFLSETKQERLKLKIKQRVSTSKSLVDFDSREINIAKAICTSLRSASTSQDPIKIVTEASKKLTSPGHHQMLLDRWVFVTQERCKEEKLTMLKNIRHKTKRYKY
jgi:hypothetical protein